jgi:hypothetical protein
VSNRFRPVLECREARAVPASFAVNSGADLNDSNLNDGIAWTGNFINGMPEVTLRAAIQQANALGVQPSAHAITFAPPQPQALPDRPRPGAGCLRPR